MTKNFEEEYRKYADSTVPDLWGRIEAAIDENSKLNEAGSDKVINIESSKRNKINLFVSRYTGFIAACACLLIAIGVIRFINNAGKNAESATAPAAYEAASDAAAPAREEYADEAVAEAEEHSYEAVAETEESEEAAVTGSASDESIAMAAQANGENYDAVSEEPLAEADYAKEAGETYDANVDKKSLAANESINSSKIRKAEQGITSESMMAVCSIEDLSRLKQDRVILIHVDDPLDSGLDKDAMISVKVDEKLLDKLSDLLLDSRSNEYTMTFELSDKEGCILTDIEIK